MGLEAVSIKYFYTYATLLYKTAFRLTFRSGFFGLHIACLHDQNKSGFFGRASFFPANQSNLKTFYKKFNI